MAEVPYVSTNMDKGSTVKASLDRISKYVPSAFSWVEIPSTTTVDLSDPTSAEGINGVGNYLIHSYTNGPSGVTRTPLSVSIRRNGSGNYVVYALDGKQSFLKTGSGTWEEAETTVSTNVSVERGAIAPSDTSVLWMDTSHYNTSTGVGYVDLKYYDGSAWVSVFQSSDIMYDSVYDTEGRNTDFFEYVDGLTNDLNATIVTFGQHKSNALTLFHLDSATRSAYNNTLVTAATVASALQNTYAAQFAAVVDEQIETNTSVGANVSELSDDLSALNGHIGAGAHITEADVANWNQKAAASHGHSAANNDVQIPASAIVSGTFTLAQLPDSIKERCYELTSLDEFTTAKTPAELAGKYHNGNTFYLDDGSGNYSWYRIIDQTKIGTAQAADGGYIEFTNEEEPLYWSSISGKPTTLAGFSINDEAYTKTEVDNLVASSIATYNALQSSYDTVTGKISLPMNNVITLDTANGEEILRIGSIKETSGSHATYRFVILTKNDDDEYRIYETYTKVDSTDGHVEIPVGVSWVKKHYADYEAEWDTYFTDVSNTYNTESSNPKFTVNGGGICLEPGSTVQTFTDPTMLYGTGSSIEFEYSTTNVVFKVSYIDLMNGAVTVEENAEDGLAEVQSDLADAYDKWGYPASMDPSDIPYKNIPGTVYGNISVGSESITRHM